MKGIFGLALLVVWLVFELKDFMFNGGFSHALAFGLLKIIFILILILALGMVTVTMNIMPIFFNKFISLSQMENNDYVSPRPKPKHLSNIRAEINRSFYRKKSF